MIAAVAFDSAAHSVRLVKQMAQAHKVSALAPTYKPDYRHGSPEMAIFWAGMSCAASIIEEALKLAAGKCNQTKS